MSSLLVPGLSIVDTPVVLGVYAALGRDVVLAQGQPLGAVLDRIRLLMLALLGSIATLFLTWGGILLLSAGGDPAQAERGKQALKSAAIGYAIAFLAPVLLTVLKQVLGA